MRFLTHASPRKKTVYKSSLWLLAIYQFEVAEGKLTIIVGLWRWHFVILWQLEKCKRLSETFFSFLQFWRISLGLYYRWNFSNGEIWPGNMFVLWDHICSSDHCQTYSLSFNVLPEVKTYNWFFFPSILEVLQIFKQVKMLGGWKARRIHDKNKNINFITRLR